MIFGDQGDTDYKRGIDSHFGGHGLLRLSLSAYITRTDTNLTHPRDLEVFACDRLLRTAFDLPRFKHASEVGTRIDDRPKELYDRHWLVLDLVFERR